MKAHVIEDGVVVNTIVVDSLDFAENLVEATVGGIGWSYADGNFTAPSDSRTDEEKSDAARKRRNDLLAETDYLALSDQTLTDDMKTYRENLRAVPEQAGFPNSVSWPTKP